jgi:hypothetical protein
MLIYAYEENYPEIGLLPKKCAEPTKQLENGEHGGLGTQTYISLPTKKYWPIRLWIKCSHHEWCKCKLYPVLIIAVISIIGDHFLRGPIALQCLVGISKSALMVIV